MTVRATGAPKHTNRLARESSPYLLQHAHNPVDWYPWGREAFEAARSQNRPIFLSIGYSTCYWCHVMERQCFENEQVAREMNQRFINIKVDREERPDVDQLYMMAVQILTRQGGWPLSVFLAPDRRPFYGATYLPPTDVQGRPGFLTILRAIDDTFRNRLADVDKTCSQVVDILQQLAEPQPPEKPLTIDWDLIGEAVDHSVLEYDKEHGGFGSAPKFPRQTLLAMLLAYVRLAPNLSDPQGRMAARKSRLREMLWRTLDAMADGGIRDQLGGGFHRYSTDERWLVPHFEIMLYDNAMLARLYAEAFALAGEPRYAMVARGICDFVLREMTSPEGAFYTAFDAEVDAQEGASYLWTSQQIEEVLAGEDAALFQRVYGLDRGPNFADPHYGPGTPDRNVLYLPEPLAQVAAKVNLTADELDAKLRPMRQALYEARRRRKQPLLDTKIITSWNALMIDALACVGRALDQPRYVHAASTAADFLLQRHRAASGALLRSSRDGAPGHAGFLDDYAFLARALLELAEAEGEKTQRRREAQALAGQMIELFGDEEDRGFYFTSADATDLIVRQKVVADSPLPSGNAVAAALLVELDQDYVARDTLKVFAHHLEAAPESASAMVEAAMVYLRCNDGFTVSPGPWRGESQRPPSPQQIAESAVSVEAVWIDPAELNVQMAIRDGFHINARAAGAGMIATGLSVLGDAAEHVEEVEYPPGEERSFGFASQPLRVYQGVVSIAVRFKRSMAGDGPIRMALSFQACNEDACFAPMTKEFEVNAL